jgi:hypothetical protein
MASLLPEMVWMAMVVVIMVPHTKRGKTQMHHLLRKKSTFERGVLRYLEGVTTDVIARGEEPSWDGLYTPKEMHHYLQQKIVDAIARGEEPRWSLCYTTRPVCC